MGMWKELVEKNEYNFYGTPQGEECLAKLLHCTKYGTLYGILFSTVDNLLISHPPTYSKALFRYGMITLPAVGIAAAFASTNCMVASVRKKDDIWNWMAGGVAAGTVFGAATRNLKFGFYGSALLAFVLGVYKDVVLDKGHNLVEIPEVHRPVRGAIWEPKLDLTIFPDPKDKKN